MEEFTFDQQPGLKRDTIDRWGDVFGDHAVAAAMIDRIVHHHAEVITLKGASHRLKNTGINTTSLTSTQDTGE